MTDLTRTHKIVHGHTCPNCGASINLASLRCEYCGTEFSPELVPIIVEHPKVRVYAAKFGVANEQFHSFEDCDGFIENIRKHIAYDLALKLLEDDLIDFDQDIDYQSNMTMLYGKIRVINKGVIL